MASAKWLIRGLFLAALAVCATGLFLVYVWMRPDFIRTELTGQLLERFYNTDIEVSTARLRLLGGISVNDLKIIRHNDPLRTPVLQVPWAILHHDKERMNEGKLVIRKIEMFKPRVQIERDRDGKWNFDELVKPPRDNEPLPIFILHQATFVFVDRRHGDQPLLEWTDVEATIINDPQPVFSFQIAGNGRPTGGFKLEGKFDKRTGLTGTLDLPNIVLGKDLAGLVDAFVPDASEHARSLSGGAAAHLELAWRTGPTSTMYHDLSLHLKQARIDHPNLPAAVEQINASIRCRNGDITIDKATARIGQGSITLSMDLPRDPPVSPRPIPLMLPSVSGSITPEVSPLQQLEDRLRSLEVVATNIPVTPELFDKLPGKAKAARDMFVPSGPLGASYSFSRHDGQWRKTLVLEPAGMHATYRGFPYPMQNVRGRVVHTVGSGERDLIEIDLKGDGAETTAHISGTIRGTHPDIDVNLRIAANGAVLDDVMINAMPDDQPEQLRRLHAKAKGDFVALIRHNEQVRRDYGPEVFANHFTIAVRDASMTYDEFPYPLENMSGTLIVKTVPDRPTRLPNAVGAQPNVENSDATTLEFRDFHATRNGSRIRGSGRKDPTPGGSILALSIDAELLALDSDLEKALKAIRVDNAWKNLSPSGRVNLSVRTKLFAKADRQADLNPMEDLELSLAFAGGAVKPNFFPYVLNDLAGRVAYAKGRVDLREFRARHGKTEVVLPTAEVLFRPTGGYWADLRDMKINPLVIDEQFLEALPVGLRSACEGLSLKGSVALQASRMVIDEQPGPFIPRDLPGAARGQSPTSDVGATAALRPGPKAILPTIYWDGRLIMAGASMNTGVDWEDIHGTIASWGLYKGDHLGAVRGNLVFDRARVARQPIEAVTASMRVDPRQPEVLSIPTIRGRLYGGDIGGEAWVMLDEVPRYALQLNAARVRLSELARQHQLPPKAHLEGLANAQLYLSNRPDERTGELVLQGGGTIDVPNGKLLNLPVLLNLIKVVKLRIPDETGFEEAHASFYLRGDRIRFGQIDLIGNAISLGGEGEMKSDGSQANFEFYPVWTKMKEMFALPGDWTGAISKRFLKIRVTGDLTGKLDYRAEPVPGLVDPVKRLVQRLK